MKATRRQALTVQESNIRAEVSAQVKEAAQGVVDVSEDALKWRSINFDLSA